MYDVRTRRFIVAWDDDQDFTVYDVPALCRMLQTASYYSGDVPTFHLYVTDFGAVREVTLKQESGPWGDDDYATTVVRVSGEVIGSYRVDGRV